MPAILKIALIFSLILALSRLKIPLFICLFSAAAAMGLWTGHSPVDTVTLILSKTISSDALWLAVIIIAIIILSQLLNQGRQMERIVSGFKAVSPGDRFTVAALPAIIGLLPMPGGALFSAPMVELTARQMKISRELKTIINYWFRHIWEYWWPLYPGILLAITLLDVKPWQLIFAQFPLSLGVLAGGILFLLPMCPETGTRQYPSKQDIGKFFYEMIPIIMVVIIMFTLNLVVKWINFPFIWPKYLNFLIALILAKIWVIRTNSLSMIQIKKGLLDKSTVNMAMIILGIMAFKGVLIDSNIISDIQHELTVYNIPVTLIIAVLPFIAGLVTGIAIGFVGTSFPVIIAILHGQVHGVEILSYSVLAYGFGYMGMMMSPVHLCFLVTKDYFKADFIGSYRLLLKPMLFVLVFTSLLYLIGRAILG